MKIQEFQFAEHSLECAIALESGELLLFRFSEAGPPPEVTDPASYDPDIVDLSGLATWEQDGFKPVLLLCAKIGKVACFSQSDIGKNLLNTLTEFSKYPNLEVSLRYHMRKATFWWWICVVRMSYIGANLMHRHQSEV
jgi:Lethal giant larvae(Lgl) like, C-terminal